MQPAGHLSVVFLCEQNLKNPLLRFSENVNNKAWIISVLIHAASKLKFLIFYVHTASRKIKKEAHELYKQETGKLEVKISAAVYVDVPVVVA